MTVALPVGVCPNCGTELEITGNTVFCSGLCNATSHAVRHWRWAIATGQYRKLVVRDNIRRNIDHILTKCVTPGMTPLAFAVDLEGQAEPERRQREREEVAPNPKTTNQVCPECGSRLRRKFGKTGQFVSCAAWPLCRYSEAWGSWARPTVPDAELSEATNTREPDGLRRTPTPAETEVVARLLARSRAPLPTRLSDDHLVWAEVCSDLMSANAAWRREQRRAMASV